MAATAAAADSTQLPFIFVNSDGKTRIVSVPDIEIYEDPIEKRDALNNAGLPSVPFDTDIFKTVLMTPETWEPSVTMTFETTDEMESSEENDAEDDDNTTITTESDIFDIETISPPMSPNAVSYFDPDEIVIIRLLVR